MNITSLFSTLKKRQASLKLPNSSLIDQLDEFSKKSGVTLYKDITLYHNTKKHLIPLLIFDKKRGIYLFEFKEWSFDDIKNSTLLRASNQDSDADCIAFEKTHELIREKLNVSNHRETLSIHNFLLMQNLSYDEYKSLDSSYKELLPLDKILFKDSKESEIAQKLNSPALLREVADELDIMGGILEHYLILSKDKEPNLATPTQIEFIESDLKGLTTLSGVASSGKTSSLLLKSISYSLKNPKLKIIIIEPTRVACDLLKERLLNTIEHGNIEIGSGSIEIITPIDLLNRHLSKLKKPKLEVVLHINKKLMQKSFKAASLIICDDTDILPLEFIDYLLHIQKESLLVLANSYVEEKSSFTLSEAFRETELQIIYKKANQHAKSLQIASSLLKRYRAKDILIVSDNLSKKRLLDDLSSFIGKRVIAVDGSLNLASQDLDGLLLCSYSDIASMNSKVVILLDIADTSLNQLQYAASLAQESLYILYEIESQNIKTLKETYG